MEKYYAVKINITIFKKNFINGYPVIVKDKIYNLKSICVSTSDALKTQIIDNNGNVILLGELFMSNYYVNYEGRQLDAYYNYVTFLRVDQQTTVEPINTNQKPNSLNDLVGFDLLITLNNM